MTFLNAAWLWGLLAVAVPILIHLLSKRGMKQSRWAAVEFLQRALQAQKRRLRLENLLLLLIRCAAVAMVAFLFAQPGCERREATDRLFSNPVNVVLLIDNTASTSQTDGRQTRLDLIKDQAIETLQKLPQGSQAGVVLLTDAGRPLVSPLTGDIGRVRRAVSMIQPTSDGGEIAESMRSAMEVLRSGDDTLPSRFLVFTDGQAEEFADGAGIEAALGTFPSARVQFFPVGEQGEANLALTSLEVTRTAFIDRPLDVIARLQNFSDKSASNVRVTLAINNEPASAEVVVPEITAGGSALAEFQISPMASGPLILTAEIPADRFALDNHRALAVEVGSQRRALLIADSPEAIPGSAAFFLSNAIVPFPPEKREEAPWKTEVSPPSALNNITEDPPAMIALMDLASLNKEAAASLAAYVQAGGSLIVFAGPEFEPSAYASDPELKNLLPAIPGAVQSASPGEFFPLQSRPFDHPITSFWNEPSSGDLSLVASDKRRVLSPSGTDAKPSTILSYADGQPAWVEAPKGRGRVILGVLPPDIAWNNLPLHPSFVGLVQRTLDFLTNSAGGSLNLQPGEEFRSPTAMDWLTREFRVKAVDSGAETRVGGRVEPGESGAVIRYRGTARPGGYLVFLTGQENPVAGFAVQVEPGESNLRQIERSSLQTWEEASGKGAASGNEKSSAVLPPIVERVGWTPLVIALLLLLVLDQSCAMFFNRRQIS